MKYVLETKYTLTDDDVNFIIDDTALMIRDFNKDYYEDEILIKDYIKNDISNLLPFNYEADNFDNLDEVIYDIYTHLGKKYF